ncbi:hypothetical protein JX265_001090 [Neoarthrinium moseri]|uniref:Uncharacterized protein n=1 Tax=Neoarthrinium moseri TaxID=1658444 RepID=A0A9P9WX53_9PEZI|nr:hypothetical protein JX265_001090 [Neoarthrinium moseri]
MSSSNQGRQSPPPEQQSGPQLKDTPGSGKGVEDVNSGDKKQEQQDQLKNLSSNSKGVLDDAVEAKFAKTAK